MRKPKAVAVPAGIEERAEKGRIAKTQRAAATEAEQAAAQKVIDCTVPTWPDEFHAMPNWLARSALFSAANRPKDAPPLQKEKIASRREVSLFASGILLDQGDADTWMHMMKSWRGLLVDGDRRISFQRKQALQGMYRSLGSSGYIWLEQSIERLKQAVITIEVEQDGKVRYRGGFNLIDEYGTDTKTGDYWIKINPQAAALFGVNMFGYIDMRKRRALGRNASLARWLYTYLVSHAPGREHSISVDLLHEWSGSKTRIGRFRELLVDAVKKLEKHDIITNGMVDPHGQARWFRPRLSFATTEVAEIQAAAAAEVLLLE